MIAQPGLAPSASASSTATAAGSPPPAILEELITLGPVEHPVTVIGVSPTRLLVNNPWSGQEWIDKTTFDAAYAIYNPMAVVLA